jgi:hypothetical protein
MAWHPDSPEPRAKRTARNTSEGRGVELCAYARARHRVLATQWHLGPWREHVRCLLIPNVRGRQRSAICFSRSLNMASGFWR